jgi:GMP synthase (glutamine-hydrolysing)
MHESFEAPAAIETWALKNNQQLSFTRLYAGDKLPADSSGFDYLIIMGGPQSIDEPQEQYPYFNAAAEIAFIKDAVERNKNVLGVCLGAQLIGEAFGAKTVKSPNKEIGFFELKLTEAAKTDPLFSTFPDEFFVGHWHGNMPGLTDSCEVLATSEGCPRQVIKYAPKVYAFQCHFEFTPEAIAGMIKNNAHELEEFKGLPFVEDATTLQSHDFSEMNSFLFRFLDWVKSGVE